jgi:glycerate kinase
MTKIIIAADSFKGSATSEEVAEAIEKGILTVEKGAEITNIPIADGGEGTVAALVKALNGTYREVNVTGPYQQIVRAKYGKIGDGKAIIEMAEASGLHLKREKDTIWDATTYGTGELILAAIEEGATDIYIGLGGSATNDGGAGMAQALGAKILKRNGEEVSFGAKELGEVETIDKAEIVNRLKDVRITLLSDVTNPLTGEKGASTIFGPQKGAATEDIKKLDQALNHFSKKVEESFGGKWSTKEGAGAAGGLGFGLLAFCDAEIKSGIEEVLKLIQLEEKVKKADLVITGEGRMDGQSTQGKAPIGVAKLAKKHGVPVVAIVGSADEDLSQIYRAGVDLVLEIVNEPMELRQAMKKSKELIERAGEKAIRAYQLKN